MTYGDIPTECGGINRVCRDHPKGRKPRGMVPTHEVDPDQACNVPWSSDSEVWRSDVYFRGPALVIGSHHQMEVETSTYEK